MKVCQRCYNCQDETCFVKDKRRKDGLYPHCKTCAKEYYAQTRERHLAQKKEYASRPEVYEREKEQRKIWYQKNKERLHEQRKEYYNSPENRAKLMFFKSRERAHIEGWEFTITVNDIVIPDTCPYLDIALTHDLGRGQLETNSSLDRIDSTKGYIPGNVQVISRLANTMKSNATVDQLVIFATNVLKHHEIQ